MSELETEKNSQKRLKLHQKFHKEILRWLRQAFKWSGLITACKAKYRLKRGVYNCGYCGDELGPKQFQIDHENPCIAIKENHTTGYNYNGIISRMFDEENLVLTCIPCHRRKTGRENSERKTGVPHSKQQTQSIKDSWTDEMKLTRSIDRGKKIICIETDEEFYSATEASKVKNINVGNIISCANMRIISAGGFHWRWEDENNYIPPKNHQKRKIICIETGEVFSSIVQAAEKLDIKTPSSISNNLAGISKKCNGYTFKYVEEK